jgi:hypothetical protein
MRTPERVSVIVAVPFAFERHGLIDPSGHWDGVLLAKTMSRSKPTVGPPLTVKGSACSKSPSRPGLRTT